jgi:hypothetical protein
MGNRNTGNYPDGTVNGNAVSGKNTKPASMKPQKNNRPTARGLRLSRRRGMKRGKLCAAGRECLFSKLMFSATP